MRGWVLLASLIGASAVAQATETKPVAKKKKSAPYSATEFIKRKETKTPRTQPAGKKAEGTGGLGQYDCQAATKSPTEQQAVADKPTDAAPADGSAVNSTQQALEMAKTVVKAVKDNCRTEKPSGTIETEVGVSVVKPGDLGEKESKGERPELSGTVGVSTTF